jgi:hypothetical protein
MVGSLSAASTCWVFAERCVKVPVMLKGLTIVNGANAGAWIAAQLEGGFGGRVKQLAPNGYGAYVRVLHPASDREDNPVTWAEVASALGRTAHREMQWHKLVGADDPYEIVGSEWPGTPPETGELDPASLAGLCRVLASHTSDPEHCFFGLSTIYSPVEDAYPKAVQLRLPGRDFVVFSGPLSAADQLGFGTKGPYRARPGEKPGSRSPDAVHWWRQPPNLIWPSDHSWYVVSEYDFDSTLIGGSRHLTDAILAAPELEVWEVEGGDSLESDADKIN